MIFPEIFQPSPNHATEPAHTREGLVLHHTVMPYEAALARLLDPASQVSYHVVIAPDGSRCALVRDEHIAWHAGVSRFRERDHCNRFLLGLSFAGDTYAEPLSGFQIESALEWIEPRWRNYRWSIDWITDHRQIAPDRKNDLNPIEWERVRASIAERFII